MRIYYSQPSQSLTAPIPIQLKKDSNIYFFSSLISDLGWGYGEIFKSDDDEPYLNASSKMESVANARKSGARGMYIEVRGKGISVRFVKNPAVCFYRRLE